ncbi:MAG: prepilin-type N-terminal cleavage/methylation domain-containing protein [Planctomycetota bacterium]|nr:prepilin-type N-terminal cleavage/methylation domain-containing protein [Planctomycetota bacterium]
MNNRIREGFTLVEILIVVVILGILAAIVVPQFTNATQDAQAGNLKAQLKSLQNQTELFNARNNGSYPGFGTDGWGSAAVAGSLIGGNYIKTAPQNPAFPGADKTSVTEVSGTARGADGFAWVWNTTDRTLYASYFDEATGTVTQNAAD